jgi:signal transduction histidine kinase
MSDERWKSILESNVNVQHEAETGSWCVVFTHVVSAIDRGVFVFGADITELRLAERELAARAAELAEVARFPEMNPGPVVRTDLTGCVLMANRAARTVFGQDLLGRSWLDTCPTIREQWSTILASDVPVPTEAKIGDRDFLFAHRRDGAGPLVFVFGADITAQRRAERALLQSEKLATLGTLAAGIAHELNNPAAATRRAADQLQDAIAAHERAEREFAAHVLTAEQRAALDAFDERRRRRVSRALEISALDRSDREASLEEWLAQLGVPDAWDLAPSLVAQGIERETLALLGKSFGGALFVAAIRLVATAYPVQALVGEIAEGSTRISEIVSAVKAYTYLGQAPVQSVDVTEGLENTLIILNSKLKQGITVRREYATDALHVPGHGSELNQVWTNIIDNAADAMNGQGTIVVRVRREDPWAVVEIEDDGPGIPPAIQSRILDPFFTTKEPGHGTGLGLYTSHSIITKKHHGQLDFESQPGRTRFTVRLPLVEPEVPPTA